MKTISAIRVIEATFKDMDSDFRLHEYKAEITELLMCAKFVHHIREHFIDENPEWKVKCKICNKTIDEIVRSENETKRS